MAESDADLSMEERVQWLRDRGVEVDLNEKPHKMNADEQPINENMSSLTLVMIPANDKESCEEIRIRISKDKSGDQLSVALKSIFASNDDIDHTLLQEKAMKQFGNMDMRVSESTVNKVAHEGNVEVFTLSRPIEVNTFQGVNIYLDEAGQLKRLPPNTRASAIASLCGYKDVAFAGDVFLGRIKVSSMGIVSNIDFRLNEISSDALWIKGVEAQNYAFGVRTNQVAMDTDLVTKSGGEDKEKGYTWDEDDSTIDISITKPSQISTARDLAVKFSSRLVKLSSKDGGWVLELKLKDSVSVDDCTWTLSSSHIEVSLEKTSKGVWFQLIAE
jgi:hypothetical protein